MEQTERIKIMEEKYDAVTDAIVSLYESLEKYNRILNIKNELFSYYSSDEWREDYNADEKGMIPNGIKRGVLSQDGIYNLIEYDIEISDMMEQILDKINS